MPLPGWGGEGSRMHPTWWWCCPDDIGWVLQARSGSIHMPTLDKLAASGLKLTFHTPPPTGAALRRWPVDRTQPPCEQCQGHRGIGDRVSRSAYGGIRPQAMTPPGGICMNGCSTGAFRKYHETPRGVSVSDLTMWPHSGFDKFCGFIGGRRTNGLPRCDGTSAWSRRWRTTTSPRTLTDQGGPVGLEKRPAKLTPDGPSTCGLASHLRLTHAKEYIEVQGQFSMGWDRAGPTGGERPRRQADARRPAAEGITRDDAAADDPAHCSEQMETFAGYARHGPWWAGYGGSGLEAHPGRLDSTITTATVVVTWQLAVRKERTGGHLQRDDVAERHRGQRPNG